MTKIDKTARIVAIKKVTDIPFTKGTKVYARVAAVLTAPTVAAAMKRGARTSTIRFAVRKRMIRVAA